MNAKPITRIDRLDILPVSAYKVIDVYRPKFEFRFKLPMFESLVAAGFPSPADDFLDKHMDLNEMLIANKQSTFLIKVKGDSMKGCGIFDQATLVVDRARKYKHGDVVLAVINGEFTCKRLRIENRRFYLCPENPDFKEILITEQMNFRVWGVVTSAINIF